MRILLTNDDGVNARGLRLLEASSNRRPRAFTPSSLVSRMRIRGL